MLKDFFKKRTDQPRINRAPMGRDLEYTEALALFDQLSALPRIPYGYLKDGCYDRSMLICDVLVKFGYEPMRAWIFNDHSDLFLKSPTGEKIQWWYHVAPALKIKMNTGGAESFIFDPALYDGPVSIEEWCKPIVVDHPSAMRLYVSKLDKTVVSYRNKNLVCCGTGWSKRLKKSRKRAENLMKRSRQRVVYQSSLRQSFNKAAVWTMPLTCDHKPVTVRPVYLDMP